MPWPASRYQVPDAPVGSTPAAAQSARSRRCVPLSSPRLTKGRLRRGDPAQRRGRVLRTRDPGRIARGTHHDEVVVHQVEAGAAVALRNERLLRRLVVHQQQVGIAIPRKAQRLAGADRNHAHLDPALGLEQRQQPVEEAGVLGRRGGGNGDEVPGSCPRRYRQKREGERQGREPA